MANKWLTPLYRLKTPSGKIVTIDVTTSVSPGLPASKVVAEQVVPFFKRVGVTRVLDFGAGALRHSFPLLDAGIEVCAVEFEAGLRRPAASEALEQARKYPDFCELVWPADLLKDKRKWEATFLCYVLQTMPLPKERDLVLKTISKRLEPDGYLLYMARYNQLNVNISPTQRVSDGYYMWPKRNTHSFYREFKTDETHKQMQRFGFQKIRSLSERGTDQMFLYAKGGSVWI